MAEPLELELALARELARGAELTSFDLAERLGKQGWVDGAVLALGCEVETVLDNCEWAESRTPDGGVPLWRDSRVRLRTRYERMLGDGY
jgi:hypothetical protein